jgi:hypothetical protein
VLVVAGAVLVPASAASAKTLTACVNKKTGEMRLRQGKAAKKKCPKGWKKVRWSVQGPAGKQGTPGVNGTNGANGQPGPIINVKDATGAVVGQMVSIFPEGGAIYFVLRDGGLWTYLGDGHLYGFGSSPTFKTNDCTGTAYLSSSSSQFKPETLAALVGGPFRVVFRTLNAGDFGTAMAWKGTATTEKITSAISTYELNDTTGACELDSSSFTGILVALEQTTAPPDFVGPLAIG